MGLAKLLVRVYVDTTVILAIILFIPGLPPYSNLESFSPTPPLPFDGALDPQDYLLSKAEKLFEGELVGPECIEVSPNEPDVFYTTLQGGVIVKIFDNGKQMKPVAKFGKKCAGNWDSRNCGRPLGIRFDKEGQLIAADSYLGIFKVDFESGNSFQTFDEVCTQHLKILCLYQIGQVSNLVSKDAVIDGKTAKTFNSVAPAKDGKIYYTVSSTNYHLDESVGEMLGAPSGRLMVYDPATKDSKVLIENIHFANGIVLSPDEDYLIFAECLRFRLHKYFLKGPKAGTIIFPIHCVIKHYLRIIFSHCSGNTEIFLDGLPGSPDNLNFSPEGNILVALVSVRLPEKFNPLEFSYGHPWIRKLGLRLLHIIKYPFDLATKYVDLPIARQLAAYVRICIL